MLRYVLLLALGAQLAVLDGAPALAASKLYDMNPPLAERHPLDTPPPAAPPAPKFGPAPGPFTDTLYNMDSLLNQRNPFDTSPPSPPPVSRSAQVVPPPTAAPREVGTPPAAPASEPDALDIYNPDSDEIPGMSDLDGRDPLEPVNRAIFGFNELVYKYFLTPLAKGYNKVVPEPVRSSLSNVLANLDGPVVLANDLLQGEFSRAGDTAARFLINSTLGVAGIADPASDLGFKKHSEDFGQTLGAWGMNEGFYLVLPLLGPSSPRDAVGKLLVDGYFDPLGYYLNDTDNTEWGYVRSGVSGFSTYAGIVDDLENLRETSVDFYGALRSLYRQRREAEILNREQGAVPTLGVR
jgi:phospholipid-binding lipoprotein MlaA